MKKYLKFLSAAVLMVSLVVISACNDDEGGTGSEIPPALIKTLTINETTWLFTYDEENNNRLEKIDVTVVGDDPYSYTYDYSVAGKLAETEAGSWGEYTTYFDIDSEGRIIRQYWDEAVTDEFEGFEYDEDGFLIRWYESIGGEESDYYTATVDDKNVTVHTSFDGETITRTKEFTYLAAATAVNVSSLPQANLRNSERRAIGGLYGRASRKLVDYLELVYPGDPEAYVKNKNTYTFDSENRVVTITRTGTDFEGNPTDLNETFVYTYYEDEE